MHMLAITVYEGMCPLQLQRQPRVGANLPKQVARRYFSAVIHLYAENTHTGHHQIRSSGLSPGTRWQLTTCLHPSTSSLQQQRPPVWAMLDTPKAPQWALLLSAHSLTSLTRYNLFRFALADWPPLRLVQSCCRMTNTQICRMLMTWLLCVGC